jgi:hypothetical protein
MTFGYHFYTSKQLNTFTCILKEPFTQPTENSRYAGSGSCFRNSSESYGTSRYITITPHIHNFHFILRSPISLGFPIKVVHMAWLSPPPPTIFHVLLISSPSWWRVQIMGVLIIHFYPSSFSFICVWSICSSQHSLFNHNLFSSL